MLLFLCFGLLPYKLPNVYRTLREGAIIGCSLSLQKLSLKFGCQCRESLVLEGSVLRDGLVFILAYCYKMSWTFLTPLLFPVVESLFSQHAHSVKNDVAWSLSSCGCLLENVSASRAMSQKKDHFFINIPISCILLEQQKTKISANVR